MSNAGRLLSHAAVSCSRFEDLSQPPPSREQADDFHLWLLCANRQLRHIVPTYERLLERRGDGPITNWADAYKRFGGRCYTSDMAFVALVRRSLLGKLTTSDHVDEVGPQEAVTSEELE